MRGILLRNTVGPGRWRHGWTAASLLLALALAPGGPAVAAGQAGPAVAAGQAGPAVAAGQAGPAVAAEPRSSRRSVSANRLYRVQLVEEAPGRCRLVVETDSGLQWVVRRCVGGPEDAYFVSRDGRSVWVVHTLPEKGTRRPWRQRVGRRWVRIPGYAAAVVAEKLDRTGRTVAVRRLSDVLGASAYGKVREKRSHFLWLAGVGGVPGKGPRMSASGAVELETVEGKTVVLPLESGGHP